MNAQKELVKKMDVKQIIELQRSLSEYKFFAEDQNFFFFFEEDYDLMYSVEKELIEKEYSLEEYREVILEKIKLIDYNTAMKARAIVEELTDFYTNTEVKNITKAAALKIRTAIAASLGNRRYFSQSGSHAILNPLSSPKYTWWGDMYWDGSGEEPLVFHINFYKEQRRIPTVSQIREIEYVLYPSGNYSFNDLAISNFKDSETVLKMMKEETDIRIFQEITQLEMG
jgi:hypothetical protein